jgi:hypothetical protein
MASAVDFADKKNKAAAELLNIKKEPAEVVSSNVETICKKHGIEKGGLAEGLTTIRTLYGDGPLGNRLARLVEKVNSLKGGRRRTQKKQRKQKNRRSRKN